MSFRLKQYRAGCKLFAAAVVIAAISVAPICSLAAYCAPNAQSPAVLGTPSFYLYEHGDPVLIPGAFLAINSGGVYDDTDSLVGYLDPSNDTVIVDGDDNIIGEVVY